MGKLVIGLLLHQVNNYNLGCAALAISNIKLMDEVFSERQIQAKYVIFNDGSTEKLPMEPYTKTPYIYRSYPRLKQVLKKPSLLTKSTIFDDCDYVIDLCGGDGYTDIYGIVRLVAESMMPLAAAKHRKKVVFAPQTIGPFNSFGGKMLARHTLRKLKKIFVRDISSYECCKQLHVEDHTFRVIDVAFALPYSHEIHVDDKFRIGMNVSGLLYNGGYNKSNYFNLSFSYKLFIDKLIEKLLQDDKIELHLIPHVISDEVEIDDDYRVIQKLHQAHPACFAAPRFDSPVEAKSYISGMDFFTGARMHSTIAAFSSGVPVVPVAYSRKFNGLYDTLKYPYYIDAKSNITCENAIEKMLEYIANVKELKANLDRSSEIYRDELKKYKGELKNLFAQNAEE